ncbi:MAG: cyclodeaminase/cyclohydrolase family protein [Chloroflexi bacterium]|nr:cyclodeaminase/cyclohydrolase family protein [Chloroflexota bacterium]
MEELASGTPTPGGGSAAAVAGAMGAALLSMVGNLTAGRERYAAVDAEMRDLIARSTVLRRRLLELMEADVAAYNRVAAAMKLPRGTDQEKAARTEELQAALRQATEAPLAIVEACAEVLKLTPLATEKGNVNAVSDAGAAALLAEAALHTGSLNVLINLGMLKDAGYVDQVRRRLEALMAGTEALKDRVVEEVKSRL